jgi:single-strand DNA-binding protein
MPNHAHITIIGHLGKDPVYDESNETARFSVAHTRKRKAGDVTTWYNVTAWRQAAKFASTYLKKGSPVCVTGSPYLDTYKDKDGADKQSLKIDASDVVALGGKEEAAAPAPRASTRPTASASSNDDEPPF